jgi:hypothetical protein
MLGLAASVVMSYTDGRVRRATLERGRWTMPLYGSIPVAVGSRPLTVVWPRREDPPEAGKRESGKT